MASAFSHFYITTRLLALKPVYTAVILLKAVRNLKIQTMETFKSS